MNPFDQLIKDMRNHVKKETECPIKPQKVCRICGKALSSINNEGMCFTHFYYQSPKIIESKPKRIRRKKGGTKSKVPMPVLQETSGGEPKNGEA